VEVHNTNTPKCNPLYDSHLRSGRANLSFADLREANLQDASVDGANFFGVNIDKSTKSSLDQLCIEAIKLKRPAIEMKLDFQDQNKHEASLLNLSEIFKAFQANLNCFGQALQLIRTGNTSESIIELTQANAFAFFPGSFGIKIVAGRHDSETEQFNLLGDSLSEDILEEFFSILNSARDSNKLQKGLLRLKHGTPKTFRNFIKKFDDARSGLSISWSSPRKPGKGGFARLKQSEIEAAIESIDEVDSEDYEIIELDDVKLISANDETKSFIIRDMRIKDKKKSKLKGYISKEALALADQNNESLEIGKKYRVRLRKIVKSFILIEDMALPDLWLKPYWLIHFAFPAFAESLVVPRY
jgi:hypothetical protein